MGSLSPDDHNSAFDHNGSVNDNITMDTRDDNTNIPNGHEHGSAIIKTEPGNAIPSAIRPPSVTTTTENVSSGINGMSLPFSSTQLDEAFQHLQQYLTQLSDTQETNLMQCNICLR
jgi:hypothetical protein